MDTGHIYVRWDLAPIVDPCVPASVSALLLGGYIKTYNLQNSQKLQTYDSGTMFVTPMGRVPKWISLMLFKACL